MRKVCKKHFRTQDLKLQWGDKCALKTSTSCVQCDFLCYCVLGFIVVTVFFDKDYYLLGSYWTLIILKVTMSLMKDTMNMLSYCFLNCNYSTVLTVEDSQKGSSHSSLQLGEF